METSATWSRALPELQRRAQMVRKRRRTFWFTGSRAWSFIAFAVVAIVFLSVSLENKYPGALVGAFVFFLVQCFLAGLPPGLGEIALPVELGVVRLFLATRSAAPLRALVRSISRRSAFLAVRSSDQPSDAYQHRRLCRILRDLRTTLRTAQKSAGNPVRRSRALEWPPELRLLPISR